MSLSMVTASLARVSEEAHEQVINPWWVGLITLVILMGMLGALVAFGGGREHT